MNTNSLVRSLVISHLRDVKKMAHSDEQQSLSNLSKYFLTYRLKNYFKIIFIELLEIFPPVFDLSVTLEGACHCLGKQPALSDRSSLALSTTLVTINKGSFMAQPKDIKLWVFFQTY